MKMYKSLALFLTVLIYEVNAAERCSASWSCKDGYSCCNRNTRCCADGLEVDAIVGIVIGCLVVVTVTILVIIYCIKKKNKHKSPMVVAPRYNNTGGQMNPTFIQYGAPQVQSYGQTNPGFNQQPVYPPPVAY